MLGLTRPTVPGTLPAARSGMLTPTQVSVSPQAWPTVAPGSRAARARWVAAASAAPPQTTSSSEPRSASAARGWVTRARSIGGAPIRTVTRWRSTSSNSWPGSKRGTVTTVAPAHRGTARVTRNPMMWENGATASTVSRSLTRPLATWRTEVTRLAWVSSTPLGSPVVPLE